MTERFDIPVVLFIFKRVDTTLRIIDVIRKVKPSKIYLISDGGRNVYERELVTLCRNEVEQAIDWECEIIKDYSETNRGVYGNIGESTIRVFKNEKKAIFLEDDNLPELSFFEYCKQMLDLYESNPKVLWVCGTNYLGNYNNDNGYSFTKHMLPCGWASWSDKFIKHYDINFTQLKKFDKKALASKFENKKLFNHYYDIWKEEEERIRIGRKPISWDYQMALTIRANNLVGTVPHKNQIRNIGVDIHSTHGGSSFDNIMTERFCGMDSYLIVPTKFEENQIKINKDLERKLELIIIPPLHYRIKGKIVKVIKKIFKIDIDAGLRSYFNLKRNK